MLLLAIDTSGKQGSIALGRAGERPADGSYVEKIEAAELSGGTFSAQLIPQIASMLSRHGFRKQDVGAFAIVSGPGSFTGLRVGLAAVKALAEVLAKPIVAVSLLEVCVFASGVQGKIMAVLDAGRGDVYVGEYEIPTATDRPPREAIFSRDEFLARSKGWTLVTPDPAIAVAIETSGLSAQLLRINAATVALLGWHKIRSGETVTPEQLGANYIRRTDAELLEKNQS
jgi:tRNA threonylcarbamoyladenosine biosynthesis protein TsaB